MGLLDAIGSLGKSKEYNDLLREEPAFIPALETHQPTKVQASHRGSRMAGRFSGGDGSKYPFGLSASGESPTLNHSLLRRNARSAYHDTPQAKALVNRFADTVVDSGLVLESTPVAEILGIKDQEAEAWARNTESRFHLYFTDKRFMRDETMNGYQAQRLVGIFQQRDNDFFTRLYYSSDRSLQNPLQISFVDPDQIGGYGITSTHGWQFNDDGIKRDARGREIAYSVYVKKDGQYKKVEIPAWGAKSKRRFMLHGFTTEYANQGRGYSRLSHALQEFENITDFTLAQIKKAINQSSINMYVKPSKDAPASDPLADISQRQTATGPASAMMGSDPTPPEGETAEQFDRLVDYIPLPEATITQPGSVNLFNLLEGEDLKGFVETAPAESFDRFVDAFCSYLSSSVGMPLEVLLMKFGENYSASRAALVLFWRIAGIWRGEMATDFLNPIYEAWLSGEIAAGRIRAPGWLDPILKQAWLANNWIGSPMPNIDPQRTAKADQIYAELGAHTLDRVARNLNGSSGKANRAKLTREYEELPASPFGKSSDNPESQGSQKKGDND